MKILSFFSSIEPLGMGMAGYLPPSPGSAGERLASLPAGMKGRRPGLVTAERPRLGLRVPHIFPELHSLMRPAPARGRAGFSRFAVRPCGPLSRGSGAYHAGLVCIGRVNSACASVGITTRKILLARANCISFGLLACWCTTTSGDAKNSTRPIFAYCDRNALVGKPSRAACTTASQISTTSCRRRIIGLDGATVATYRMPSVTPRRRRNPESYSRIIIRLRLPRLWYPGRLPRLWYPGCTTATRGTDVHVEVCARSRSSLMCPLLSLSLFSSLDRDFACVCVCVIAVSPGEICILSH